MPEVISLAAWRFERQKRLDEEARRNAMVRHKLDDGKSIAAQLDRLTASLRRIEEQMAILRNGDKQDRIVVE